MARYLIYHPESDSLFEDTSFDTDGLCEDATGIPEYEERAAREKAMCKYCADTGHFHGDPEFGSCGCLVGDPCDEMVTIPQATSWALRGDPENTYSAVGDILGVERARAKLMVTRRANGSSERLALDAGRNIILDRSSTDD